MKRIGIAVLMFTIAIALAVVSWLTLPDQVVLQIPTNITEIRPVSKAVGVALPLVVSGLGIGLYCFGSDGRRGKNFFLAIVGYALFVITWALNK